MGMKSDHRRSSAARAAAAVVGCVLLAGAWTPALAQAPQVQAPQPTVPEVFTIMGQFVRVAYNKEGFVTLGYEMAQRAIGEEWLMLEVGLTMRSPAKDYKLKREHFTLKTPEGTMIPLASQSDYAGAGYLTALNNRAKVIRDSINYFPVEVTRGCSMIFFANVDQGRRMLAFDEVELSSTRACVGRLYFKVPGGIKVGQHWLIVDFGPSGKVEVPFRILTKEEEKQFKESWQDIKKAHDASYQQPKKEKE
jgi:hypothetical protein